MLALSCVALLFYQWPDGLAGMLPWLSNYSDQLGAAAALVAVLTAVLMLLVWLGKAVASRLPPLGARGRYLRWLLDRRQYLDFKGLGVSVRCKPGRGLGYGR